MPTLRRSILADACPVVAVIGSSGCIPARSKIPMFFNIVVLVFVLAFCEEGEPCEI
jgi:hypothetical protein